MELVEFQEKLPLFNAEGLAVIGISYDPVDVLALFSKKYNIQYPLLADTSSQIIRAFGLLNTQIDSAKKSFGVPYPGLLFIDKHLKIIDKHFEKSYAARPTAETVLATHLNTPLMDNTQTFKNSYLRGQISLSDSVVTRAQVLTLTLKMDIKQGFHVYGRPIPEGYFPLQIEFSSNKNFSVDPFSFPPTTKLHMDTIEETFHILPQTFKLMTNLRIAKNATPDDYRIESTLSFQACNSTTCMLPQEIQFSFPLKIVEFSTKLD